jgi:hypothetical protein
MLARTSQASAQHQTIAAYDPLKPRQRSGASLSTEAIRLLSSIGPPPPLTPPVRDGSGIMALLIAAGMTRPLYPSQAAAQGPGAPMRSCQAPTREQAGQQQPSTQPEWSAGE